MARSLRPDVVSMAKLLKIEGLLRNSGCMWSSMRWFPRAKVIAIQDPISSVDYFVFFDRGWESKAECTVVTFEG